MREANQQPAGTGSTRSPNQIRSPRRLTTQLKGSR